MHRVAAKSTVLAPKADKSSGRGARRQPVTIGAEQGAGGAPVLLVAQDIPAGLGTASVCVVTRQAEGGLLFATIPPRTEVRE